MCIKDSFLGGKLCTLTPYIFNDERKKTYNTTSRALYMYESMSVMHLLPTHCVANKQTKKKNAKDKLATM